MASFSWTTPERRSGQRHLPFVANEIYFDIFDYVEYSDELSAYERRAVLSNLALVCRFFCAMCLPRVFKSLEISSAEPHVFSKGQGNAPFCRAIVSNQELASSLVRHVQECTFLDWNDSVGWVYAGFIDLYTGAMARMSNLRTLTFASTHIDAKIFKTIACLSNLTKLSFDSCGFSTRFEAKDFEGFSQLKHLSSFRFHSVGVNVCLDLARALHRDSLRILDISDWSLACHIISDPTQLQIEELNLGKVYDVVALRDFLNRTPTIQKLRIESLTSKAPSLIGLSSDSLPRLRAVACSASLVPEFASCQLLEDITLLAPHNILDAWLSSPLEMPTPSRIFAALKDLKTQIRKIHISFPAYLSAPQEIQQYLGDVEELFIPVPWASDTVPSCQSNIAEICQWWSIRPPKRLRTIGFDKGPPSKARCSDFLDLQAQYNLLTTAVVPTFPSVVNVIFTSSVRWWRPPPFRHSNEDYIFTDDWRPYVPGHYREYVKEAVIDPKFTVTDFKGCFMSLFDNNTMGEKARAILASWADGTHGSQPKQS